MEFIEGALFRFLLGEIVGDGEGQGEVAESGQMGEEVEGLKDHSEGAAVADPFGFIGGDGGSVDFNRAVIREI